MKRVNMAIIHYANQYIGTKYISIYQSKKFLLNVKRMLTGGLSMLETHLV